MSSPLDNGTRPQRRPGPHPSGDALEVLCPEVLEFKEIAEKFSRGLGDDDGVGLGDALQPRSEVRRLADDAALLCVARADQITDYDQPSGNSDASLQGSVGFERTDSTNPLPVHPHRPLAVVLVGLRIAEIDQHAVAHVFRHEAIETAHGVGYASLIGRMTSRKSSGSMRAESAVEPTRSKNITVTWRRSAVSWVFGSVNAGCGDVGAAPASSTIAANIFRRCPSETPSSLRS